MADGLDLVALGRAIAMRRASLRLSRNGLAERAGISGPYLIDVELGGSRVGAEVLARLAGALGVSVDELLRDAGWRGTEPVAGELGEVYGELSDYERRVLLRVARALVEVRGESELLEYEPMAAYDREPPEDEA